MAVINLIRDRHLLTGRVHRARGLSHRLTLLRGLSRSPQEVRLQPGHHLGVKAASLRAGRGTTLLMQG